MSAHAHALPVPAPQPERQPRLFALPGGAEAAGSPQRPVAALVPVPSPADMPRPATVAAAALALAPAPTMDSELRLAWTALTAGAPAACFFCDGRMEPLAHAPGGACTSCGTTLE